MKKQIHLMNLSGHEAIDIFIWKQPNILIYGLTKIELYLKQKCLPKNTF